MYSDKIGATEFEIEGPSLEACKKKLFDKYGEDYQIRAQKTSLKGGFLGFGQHEVVKINYIVAPHVMPKSNLNSSINDDKESFNRSRDEFLKQSGASVTNTLQLAQLAKKIDQMSQEMNEKLTTISQVASVREDHASIQKIEALL